MADDLACARSYVASNPDGGAISLNFCGPGQLRVCPSVYATLQRTGSRRSDEEPLCPEDGRDLHSTCPAVSDQASPVEGAFQTEGA